MEEINTSGVKIYKLPFIYITYCFHPDKFLFGYIGSHCCNNDNYLGSGSLLNFYIQKFGRKYFKRYVLEQLHNNSRSEVLSREQYWINLFNAEQSEMFFNQRSFTSGGYVIKDKEVHKFKTKQGMLNSNAHEKIKIHANKEISKQKSRENLKFITPEHRQEGIKNRNKNRTWKEHIIKRNKLMALDKNWKLAHKNGILLRDNFVSTPEGIFKNATDAGKFFGVSNVSIINRINNNRCTDWKSIDNKNVQYIDVSHISKYESLKMKKKYFSKVAVNKIAIVVHGIQYESKHHVKKTLGWSQSKLENYLKKENKDE